MVKKILVINSKKFWNKIMLNIVYTRSKYTTNDISRIRNYKSHNKRNDKKETGQAKAFCSIHDKSKPYFGLCFSTFALRILGPRRVPI
jgi:hypothetical protein